jgi:hypothetical protein
VDPLPRGDVVSDRRRPGHRPQMSTDPEKRAPVADTPPSSTSPSAAGDLDHVGHARRRDGEHRRAESNARNDGDRHPDDPPHDDGLRKRIEPLRHLRHLLTELKRRTMTNS